MKQLSANVIDLQNAPMSIGLQWPASLTKSPNHDIFQFGFRLYFNFFLLPVLGQFLFDFVSVPQNNIDVNQGQKSVVKETKIMDERMETCHVCYPCREHSVSLPSKPF